MGHQYWYLEVFVASATAGARWMRYGVYCTERCLLADLTETPYADLLDADLLRVQQPDGISVPAIDWVWSQVYELAPAVDARRRRKGR